MTRITLSELLKKIKTDSYQDQYRYIMEKIERDEIRPVKSSGLNGKKPALYLRYWVVEEEKDYSPLIEELKYSLSPEIRIDYYLKHLKVYEQEREAVKSLDRFLRSAPAACPGQSVSQRGEGTRPRVRPVSINERSFEIWQREKFLTREEGRRILRHCGVGMERLMIYETSEPLAYYTYNRKTPQNMLFIENKDTYFSMRRHLIASDNRLTKAESAQSYEGVQPGRILGLPIGTLIYGGGKRILSSGRDFALSAEPYMMDRENTFLYFGDLDYEGIRIYEDYARLLIEQGRDWDPVRLLPFRQGYEAMIHKAENIGLSRLPETKEKQNQNISQIFFSHFGEDVEKKMKEILVMGRYIPQEILNINDLKNIYR